MAHDTHFLERLERLSAHHVEWALSMYRDPEFVRLVLTTAKIGDGVERIALSLDDPHEGPFVVVDRNGVFITCLGTGMKPTNLPVVPRYVLDTQVQRLEVLRARKAVFEERLQRLGTLPRLFKRIWEAGHRVSREEFIAASAMVPVIRDMLWKHQLGLLTPMMAAYRRLFAGNFEKRLAKPTDADLADMRTVWTLAWQSGHAYALAAVDPEDPEESTVFGAVAEMDSPNFDVSWVAVRTGLVPILLRAAYNVGVHGKVFLKHTKRRLVYNTHSPSTFIGSFMTLMAIGMRHPKLVGEINKTFEKATFDNIKNEDHMRDYFRGAVNYGQSILRLSTQLIEASPQACATMLHAELPLIRDMYKTPEDIPPELCCTIGANLPGSVYDIGTVSVFPLVETLPLVIKKPPEMMYFKEQDLGIFTEPWTCHHSIEFLVKPMRDIIGVAGPTVNVGPKIGRNDPCPCKSGKKYKVCCGK